jgi:hypothetical protein
MGLNLVRYSSRNGAVRRFSMWLISLVGIALFAVAGIAMARLLIGAISGAGTDSHDTLWGIFWAGFIGGSIFWTAYLILSYNGFH